VIFVYHFTRYIWFYLLKQKSEVKTILIKFKAIVEKHFDKTIKTFYSNNDGEYIALSHFLSKNGISHLTTSPHTPKHNGFFRKETSSYYRNWISITITCLFSFKLLDLSLSYNSLFDKLFANTHTKTFHFYMKFFFLKKKTTPNYSKLKIFGCLCYPWLKTIRNQ